MLTLQVKSRREHHIPMAKKASGRESELTRPICIHYISALTDSITLSCKRSNRVLKEILKNERQSLEKSSFLNEIYGNEGYK